MIGAKEHLNLTVSYISLYDLATLGAIFIALHLALLLALAKRVNRVANRLLALVLVIMVSGLIWLPVPALLALGPLLYFYTSKLNFSTYQFRRKGLVCP